MMDTVVILKRLEQPDEVRNSTALLGATWR